MSVQKQKHTKGRRDRARVFLALSKKKLVPCSNCHTMILPHIVCSHCGYYKGAEVVDTIKKINKKKLITSLRAALWRTPPRNDNIEEKFYGSFGR